MVPMYALTLVRECYTKGCVQLVLYSLMLDLLHQHSSISHHHTVALSVTLLSGYVHPQAQRGGSDGATQRPSSATAGSFKVGMKIEAKDRKYPTLTCVATIQDIRDGQLLVHFDGWPGSYDYWCPPDSTDIHPQGWCSKHGLKLQAPKGTIILRMSLSQKNMPCN